MTDTLKPGDRVAVARDEYDRDLMSGEIGRVVSAAGETVGIRFGDRVVETTQAEAAGRFRRATFRDLYAPGRIEATFGETLAERFGRRSDAPGPDGAAPAPRQGRTIEKIVAGALPDRPLPDRYKAGLMAHQQRLAETALNRRLTVVGMIPGHGHSHAMTAAAEACRDLGDNVVLACVLGREAQMFNNRRKLDGVEAVTVHKLLGARRLGGGEGHSFEKDVDNRLPPGAVVIVPGLAEMLPPDVLDALVEALPDDGRLVLGGMMQPGNVVASFAAAAARNAADCAVLGFTPAPVRNQDLTKQFPPLGMDVPRIFRQSPWAFGGGGETQDAVAQFLAAAENQDAIREAARDMLAGPLGAELRFDAGRSYGDDYGYERFLLARLAAVPGGRREDILAELRGRAEARQAPTVGGPRLG